MLLVGENVPGGLCWDNGREHPSSWVDCHLYHLVVGLIPETPGRGQKGQPKQVYKVATTRVSGQALWDLLAPVACGADFSIHCCSVACPHPTL